MPIPDYDDHDATSLAELVRTKKATPRELVDAAIERIEARNPKLNAVITPLFERARAAADGPLPEGTFRGVPFLLKDIVGTLAGVPMSSGSRFYGDWAPSKNSVVVDRFLAHAESIDWYAITPA